MRALITLSEGYRTTQASMLEYWHDLSSIKGMSKHKTREEILAQAEAFSRMNGNELDLIRAYAEDFRDIISEFEAKHGRVPTADDLLWIESQRRGRDITLD